MGGTEWGTFSTRRHVETLRNCREGGTFSTRRHVGTLRKWREGGTFATRRHVGNCRVVFFLFFLISPRFGSGAPMFCSGFFLRLCLCAYVSLEL